MRNALNALGLPIIAAALVLIGIYIWGGSAAFLIALLLILLEITLSFDNAVVNARILGRMGEKWQRRFLTWGILIAVFGTRFILPILIVSASVGLSPVHIAQLAVWAPEQYGELLAGARYAISVFGGMFLLMVSLKYFFSEAKSVHWIRIIEKTVAGWGRVEAIEIGICLAVLMGIALTAPAQMGTIFLAGTSGIITFIVIQGIANTFTRGAEHSEGIGNAALFLYLNVLDAAFSLDGVVGAFALTNQILLIVAGLGVGAYFVRSLTVYLVQKKTLDTLVYLEQGAHWAILALALALLASIFIAVPDIIIGTIGLLFVGAAYRSSAKLIRGSLKN